MNSEAKTSVPQCLRGCQLKPIGSDADALRSAIAYLLQAAAQTSHPPTQNRQSPEEVLCTRSDLGGAHLTPQLLAYVAHLFWLRQQLELGFFPASGLTAEEAQGLLLLQGEIQKLESARRCPHCGAPTKSITHCDTCKRPLPSPSSAHGPLPSGNMRTAHVGEGLAPSRAGGVKPRPYTHVGKGR